VNSRLQSDRVVFLLYLCIIVIFFCFFNTFYYDTTVQTDVRIYCVYI